MHCACMRALRPPSPPRFTQALFFSAVVMNVQWRGIIIELRWAAGFNDPKPLCFGLNPADQFPARHRYLFASLKVL
jgi:hypothetical protein